MEFTTTLNGTTMPVLVLWQLHAPNKDALFAHVYQELYQRGWVHPTYLAAVKRREEEYPTGLDFGNFSIALPHIDTEHVIRSAMVVALLQEPLLFQAMDDPEQTLSCQLAIFPVLGETKEQVIFLSAVTTALQQAGFYDAIIGQPSAEKATDLLNHMCASYVIDIDDA